MKLSIIGLVALGMIAAFSAALLMAAMGKTPNRLANQRGEEPVDVIVAVADMPSMTVIEAPSFRTETMKAREAPAGYLSKPVQVLGKPLTRRVVAGQALTADCFASNKRGVELVAALPAGKRAVTVELALSAGLEGLLYPGSVVDVVASFSLNNGEMRGMAVSTTLLHGIEVLAIDAETVGEAVENPAGKTVIEKPAGTSPRLKTRRVTLLVDPRQAEALQLASEHGTVSLALRNPLDKTDIDADVTLLNQGRLAGLAEYLGATVGPSAPAASPVVDGSSPAPAAAQSRPGDFKWDVTVLRGTQIEVRTFALEPEAPLGAPLAADNASPSANP